MELEIRPSPALADVHKGVGLTTEERAALLRAVWVTLADADIHIFGATAGDDVTFDVRVFGTIRILTFRATVASWFPISDWTDVTADQLLDLDRSVGTVVLESIEPSL